MLGEKLVFREPKNDNPDLTFEFYKEMMGVELEEVVFLEVYNRFKNGKGRA